MARIKDFTIKFPASPSPDVEAYKMYFVPTGGTLDYDSLFVGIPFTGANPVTVNLAEILPASLDGSFDIGVVAVDDVGNESDMSVLLAVPLDFLAPQAPGPVEIVVGLAS